MEPAGLCRLDCCRDLLAGAALGAGVVGRELHSLSKSARVRAAESREPADWPLAAAFRRRIRPHRSSLFTAGRTLRNFSLPRSQYDAAGALAQSEKVELGGSSAPSLDAKVPAKPGKEKHRATERPIHLARCARLQLTLVMS